MGVAAYRRGSANLVRPLQEAVDHANYVDESFRLLVAADAAVEFCREVNAKLAEIHAGKGIAAAQRRAYLECHVGQNRRAKYIAACTEWRDAYGQRPVAFAALKMRKAAEFLMEWIP